MVVPKAESLKFDPAAPEVKQGGKVSVNVPEGQAETATAPDGSKLKTTLNPAKNKIEIEAEATAPLGEVEITVKGGNKLPTAKFKVKVIK